MVFRNKKSVLCLVVLVFCVTLTLGLCHFNAVECANVQFWLMGAILYSSQIYISDMKWGGESELERWWSCKEVKVAGLRPCLISHDTFVKQSVTLPLLTHIGCLVST